MGEYAEADIWARQNGMEDGIADMGAEDWSAFYKQHTDDIACPVCGNYFSSYEAVLVHADVHKKRRHLEALAEWREIMRPSAGD